jgi:uncharacterized protein YukE
MAEFTFNFVKCDQSLDNIEQIYRQITGALDSLEQNVEKSLQEWQSEPVKGAYWRAKAEWDQSADQMATFLGQARATLDGVRATYLATEKSNEGGWEQAMG